MTLYSIKKRMSILEEKQHDCSSISIISLSYDYYEDFLMARKNNQNSNTIFIDVVPPTHILRETLVRMDGKGMDIELIEKVKCNLGEFEQK